MSEIKNTQESETDQEKNIEQRSDLLKNYIAENGKPLIAIDDRVLVTLLKELLTGHEVNPYDPVLLENIFMRLKNVFDEDVILKAFQEARNDFKHGNPSDKTIVENLDKFANEMTNLRLAFVPLLIDVKTLTPQTVALVFTALTELTTKL